ncbi:hypothetical protein G4G28_05850 [Massilia sp. Dwa41.01b]|uniref:hypothetical protein n=1 Tax=unclassified Massilia TaxID=2609279 RepID=UPI001600C433|nr:MULTISPECIES: hypothetical protein [unclassified Massilia]QNA88135.1 hypothetical protein G4G28_05850 [Massilia sp. Dwa41.01b]QNA99041.1 hypothetical protein G4G31_09575 [Massilia sp. Se16.2.3]
MKRIEVDEKAFDGFEDYRGKDDASRALGRLVRYADRKQEEEADRIALVMLEDHWFDFNDNPGQASNAPFLEGVCRLYKNIRSYRLNFYDADSFGHALAAVATLPESRIVLYIGAHGSKGRIGAANSSNLMKKVAEFSRKKKIEGILLSSCFAAGHDGAMQEALKGGSNWIFGYRTAVDFLGSVQVEAAILAQMADTGAGFSDTGDDVVAAVGKALGCFNPAWEIGEEPCLTLRQAFRLLVRGKHMKTVVDYTQDAADKAWP